jgi:predicted component of type VI protein secretion system
VPVESGGAANKFVGIVAYFIETVGQKYKKTINFATQDLWLNR